MPRWHLVCPACWKPFDRLPQHLDTCPKRRVSGLSKEELLALADEKARLVCRSNLVEAHQLYTICEKPTAPERYVALRELLISAGFHVYNVDDIATKLQMASTQATNEKFCTSSLVSSCGEEDPGVLTNGVSTSNHNDDGDEELVELLKNARPVKIEDPMEGIDFANGSLKKKIQEEGLYKRLNENCALMIQKASRRR